MHVIYKSIFYQGYQADVLPSAVHEKLKENRY